MKRSTAPVRANATVISAARHLTAYTGAGISVASGIPWSKHDPRLLEIRCFLAHPEGSWPVIKEIFYDQFGAATPARAHEVPAAWETSGLLKTVTTQNPACFSDGREMPRVLPAS